MKFLASSAQTLQPEQKHIQIHRWTDTLVMDRYTDRQTELKLLDYLPASQWRKSSQFRQICLFTLEIYMYIYIYIYIFQVIAKNQVFKCMYTFLA